VKNMKKIIAAVLLFSFAITFRSEPVSAEGINLLPKYGSGVKSQQLIEEDKKFLATADSLYKGDRAKASRELSDKGWQFLRNANPKDAMQSFNQAWLLDNKNGGSVWGMGAIQSGLGKPDEALKLFSEAETLMGEKLDFEVDHAKAVGFGAVQIRDEALLKDAFARFASIYEKAPRHALNLQNWAITLFYIGNYAESWKKIILAEKVTTASELDSGFMAALQAKMPRP